MVLIFTTSFQAFTTIHTKHKTFAICRNISNRYRGSLKKRNEVYSGWPRYTLTKGCTTVNHPSATTISTSDQLSTSTNWNTTITKNEITEAPDALAWKIIILQKVRMNKPGKVSLIGRFRALRAAPQGTNRVKNRPTQLTSVEFWLLISINNSM